MCGFDERTRHTPPAAILLRSVAAGELYLRKQGRHEGKKYEDDNRYSASFMGLADAIINYESFWGVRAIVLFER